MIDAESNSEVHELAVALSDQLRPFDDLERELREARREAADANARLAEVTKDLAELRVEVLGGAMHNPRGLRGMQDDFNEINSPTFREQLVLLANVDILEFDRFMKAVKEVGVNTLAMRLMKVEDEVPKNCEVRLASVEGQSNRQDKLLWLIGSGVIMGIVGAGMSLLIGG